LSERRYRDPVHNIISLSWDSEFDRLLIALIDTPEFQRLRRIKQLGLALYTYQGAEHSRFTHSLGVMHLMNRVLGILSSRYSIPQEASIVGRCAALLHDIGHGPFSHVIEKALKVNHESWTCRIILDAATAVNRTLGNFDPSLPEKITALLKHEYKPDYISQLVSGQLDCDRMDYLLRDSLMTGAKYGNYDLEWIIQALEIDQEQDRIFVSHRGLYAVEEYLQARYYMFRQVYFHRSLRAAEGILLCIMRRAVELMQQGKLSFYVPGSVFEKILRQQETSTEEYVQLDDSDILFHVKQWMQGADPILSDLSARFLYRLLFKAIDLDLPDAERQQFTAAARRIVEDAGYDPRFYLIEDSATDVPYYRYYLSEAAEPKERIYVQLRKGSSEVCEIGKVSAVVRGLRSYQINRLFFPAEVSKQIYALAK